VQDQMSPRATGARAQHAHAWTGGTTFEQALRGATDWHRKYGEPCSDCLPLTAMGFEKSTFKQNAFVQLCASISDSEKGFKSDYRPAGEVVHAGSVGGVLQVMYLPNKKGWWEARRMAWAEFRTHSTAKLQADFEHAVQRVSAAANSDLQATQALKGVDGPASLVPSRNQATIELQGRRRQLSILVSDSRRRGDTSHLPLFVESFKVSWDADLQRLEVETDIECVGWLVAAMPGVPVGAVSRYQVNEPDVCVSLFFTTEEPYHEEGPLVPFVFLCVLAASDVSEAAEVARSLQKQLQSGR